MKQTKQEGQENQHSISQLCWFPITRKEKKKEEKKNSKRQIDKNVGSRKRSKDECTDTDLRQRSTTCIYS